MIRTTLTAALVLILVGPQCANEPKTPEQLREEFLTWRFGMFLHFNMATFNDREWASGYEDPGTFAPDQLDFGQWADAAKSAGMKYAVLTVKHTGAWNLWDSKQTVHDATAFSSYRDGEGDLVREYVDAFRERDMKVGFYYCLPGNYTGRWGAVLPEGEPDLHGLPPEAEGDYVGFMKAQFEELLRNYGPIDLLWIDQWGNEYTGAQWRELLAHIKSLQPNCVVIANNARDFRDTDIRSYEYPWTIAAQPDSALPPVDNVVPAEVSDKMGPSWFWNTSQDQSDLMQAREIVAMLKLSNDRRANYLINVAPDTTGLLPVLAVQRLKEVGDLLREAGEADNGELLDLYKRDQTDRSGGFDGIDWTVVSRRDSMRQARVRELLETNQVRTPADYRHAAMVFQHGRDTTAARVASELARQSVALDSTNADAKWLMAAAWDRYQMRLGKPQWYGTQFVRDSPESSWRLYDVDTTAVSDEERQRLGVRTLREANARVEEMNARASR